MNEAQSESGPVAASDRAAAPEPSGPVREPSRQPSRESSGTASRRGRGLVRAVVVFLREVVIVVVLALALAFVAKTWFVQSFYIPSGSMLNTLAKDDRVMVSKLTPGPFDLQRGDIVVFEDPAHWLPPHTGVAEVGPGGRLSQVLTWVGLLPSDAGNHLIKRVIGLPGDRVQCCARDGRLQINGVAVTEPYLHPGDAPSRMRFDITVPEGKIWVMGDHRSDSSDSRYNDTAEEATGIVDETTASDPRNKTGYYGSVPLERVVGKALAVILPISKMTGLGTPEGVFAGVPAPAPTAAAQTGPSATAPGPAPARTPAP